LFIVQSEIEALRHVSCKVSLKERLSHATAALEDKRSHPFSPLHLLLSQPFAQSDRRGGALEAMGKAKAAREASQRGKGPRTSSHRYPNLITSLALMSTYFFYLRLVSGVKSLRKKREERLKDMDSAVKAAKKNAKDAEAKVKRILILLSIVNLLLDHLAVVENACIHMLFYCLLSHIMS
jgi:hypothetical protein